MSSRIFSGLYAEIRRCVPAKRVCISRSRRILPKSQRRGLTSPGQRPGYSESSIKVLKERPNVRKTAPLRSMAFN